MLKIIERGTVAMGDPRVKPSKLICEKLASMGLELFANLEPIYGRPMVRVNWLYGNSTCKMQVGFYRNMVLTQMPSIISLSGHELLCERPELLMTLDGVVGDDQTHPLCPPSTQITLTPVVIGRGVPDLDWLSRDRATLKAWGIAPSNDDGRGFKRVCWLRDGVLVENIPVWTKISAGTFLEEYALNSVELPRNVRANTVNTTCGITVGKVASLKAHPITMW